MIPYVMETAHIRLRCLTETDILGDLPVQARIAAYAKHPVHADVAYTLAVCAQGNDVAVGYIGLVPGRDCFVLEQSIPDVFREEAMTVFLSYVPHRFGINAMVCGDTLLHCGWEMPSGGNTLYGDCVTLICTRRDVPDVERGWAAAMHFDIQAGGMRAGTCSLRLGYNEALFYGGQISYTVFPAYRGHGYAASAARAMTDYAFLIGMPQLTITCVPQNLASRKTAEHAGFSLETICPIPQTMGLYSESRREVCRYTRLFLP